VGPHVGFEMGALGVGLAAAWVGTCVSCGALAAPGTAPLLADDLGCSLGLWGWHVGICWGVAEQIEQW